MENMVSEMGSERAQRSKMMPDRVHESRTAVNHTASGSRHNDSPREDFFTARVCRMAG